MRINGKLVGGVRIGGEVTLFGAAPPSGAYATISVTCGRLAAQDLDGFSAPHNVGSVDPTTYTLVGDSTSNIRQLGATSLAVTAGRADIRLGVRFHLDTINPAITNPHTENFDAAMPDRLVVTRGADTLTLSKSLVVPVVSTGASSAGRGWVDYHADNTTENNAALRRIFASGGVATVELYYD